jgi:lipoxygenase
MEMSSAVYSEWTFTDQSLPNELIKRGMTSKQDPRTAGSGGATSTLHLHVEDYLYAVGGMDMWRTIEGQVRRYYAHFYYSDTTVATDAELQAWWADVRRLGHGDRRRDLAC